MWPHLRAALIALHLLYIALAALPSLDAALDRAAWQDPTIQGELTAWTTRLNALGFQITPENLENRLWQVAVGYTEVRSAVLEPVDAYRVAFGLTQAWNMFAAPHRHPTALHIELCEAGQWRPIYRERDSRDAWRGRQLDSYRFRSVLFRFGWPAYWVEYEGFTRWVAARAAADFPEAEAVRVHLFKSRTRSPEEVRAGLPVEGEFTLPVIHTLEAYREAK